MLQKLKLQWNHHSMTRDSRRWITKSRFDPGCAHLCYTPSGESTARPLGELSHPTHPTTCSQDLFALGRVPNHPTGAGWNRLRRHRQPGLQSPRDPHPKKHLKGLKVSRERERERYCIYIYWMENPRGFKVQTSFCLSPGCGARNFSALGSTHQLAGRW